MKFTRQQASQKILQGEGEDCRSSSSKCGLLPQKHSKIHFHWPPEIKQNVTKKCMTVRRKDVAMEAMEIKDTVEGSKGLISKSKSSQKKSQREKAEDTFDECYIVNPVAHWGIASTFLAAREQSRESQIKMKMFFFCFCLFQLNCLKSKFYQLIKKGVKNSPKKVTQLSKKTTYFLTNENTRAKNIERHVIILKKKKKMLLHLSKNVFAYGPNKRRSLTPSGISILPG